MLTLLAVVAVLGVLFVAAVVATREGEVLVDAPPDVADVVLPAGPLQPADLASVRFGLALRGYRMSEVDAVLDRAQSELAERDARIRELESGGPLDDEDLIDSPYDDAAPFALTDDDPGPGAPAGPWTRAGGLASSGGGSGSFAAATGATGLIVGASTGRDDPDAADGAYGDDGDDADGMDVDTDVPIEAGLDPDVPGSGGPAIVIEPPPTDAAFGGARAAEARQVDEASQVDEVREVPVTTDRPAAPGPIDPMDRRDASARPADTDGAPDPAGDSDTDADMDTDADPDTDADMDADGDLDQADVDTGWAFDEGGTAAAAAHPSTDDDWGMPQVSVPAPAAEGLPDAVETPEATDAPASTPTTSPTTSPAATPAVPVAPDAGTAQAAGPEFSARRLSPLGAPGEPLASAPAVEQPSPPVLDAEPVADGAAVRDAEPVDPGSGETLGSGSARPDQGDDATDED